jgi:hypothetical protein
MNVAFLANSFHLKKTKSADFFIDLLRASFGEVEVIPHSEAWVRLPRRRWDLIVVWQHRYPPEVLEAFGSDRVVLVPMYDDTPSTPSFGSGTGTSRCSASRRRSNASSSPTAFRPGESATTLIRGHFRPPTALEACAASSGRARRP